MSICPACNAFIQLTEACSSCQGDLQDGGKLADFLDPYGHYNDTDTLKLGDGIPHTIQHQVCPHLMYCKNCGIEKITYVQEQ